MLHKNGSHSSHGSRQWSKSVHRLSYRQLGTDIITTCLLHSCEPEFVRSQLIRFAIMRPLITIVFEFMVITTSFQVDLGCDWDEWHKLELKY